MLMKTFLLLFSILLLVTACNDDQFLEYHTKDTETQLSLSGFVCEDSIYVCLTETFQANYLIDDTTITPIITDTSAEVTIYEDGNYFCTLQAKSIPEAHWYTGGITPKNYYVAYMPIQAGSNYAVSFDHEKYGAFYAETRMPIKPEINLDIQTIQQIVTIGWDDFSDGWEYVTKDTLVWNTYFTLSLFDNDLHSNYYQVDFHLDAIMDKGLTGFNFSAVNTTYNSRYYHHHLFTDELSNGSSYDVEFSVFQPYADSVSVDFILFSEDYYNYLISMIAYHEAERDPFSKPINLYSNVSNGFGVFGAYQKFRFQNY
jgi:hypothetical protein